MKTLYIVRHAKSSWDHPGLGDDQRPLLEKGKKRTKYVVDYFLENNCRPDLIISSHAVRAFETAKIIAAEKTKFLKIFLDELKKELAQ